MRKLLAAIAAALLTAAPAYAQYSYEFKAPARFTKTTQFDGAVTHSSTVTNTGTVTNSGNMTVGGTLGVTGATTLSSTAAITGNTTVGGTLGVTGALSLTVPLTKANANTSIKRMAGTWQVNAGGTIADGATYRAWIAPGRAATITKVTCLCGTAPIGGTSTVKVLKASSSGNTMLGAASLDPTTLSNNAITAPALTATSADLGLSTTQGAYLEWVAGTQTTDGVNCTVGVEYELDDI